MVGHDDDFAGIRVERVFAGQERLAPHAALALGDELAVLVLDAREVAAVAPVYETTTPTLPTSTTVLGIISTVANRRLM